MEKPIAVSLQTCHEKWKNPAKNNTEVTNFVQN
jgi:hypothetical protein